MQHEAEEKTLSIEHAQAAIKKMRVDTKKSNDMTSKHKKEMNAKEVQLKKAIRENEDLVRKNIASGKRMLGEIQAEVDPESDKVLDEKDQMRLKKSQD